ncbi:MAG: tRNA (adenosine(37)-N6)-dimethylallyltransferase MiaA [Candidatus Zixiibacteriota bacterium]
MPDFPPIPIICGPTGSGKTAVAVVLANQFPLEIVSADSRQIIKHLDIGTAKPTIEEQLRVRFHLLDLVEPGERYNAYRFIVDAEAAIGDIRARQRLPIVVGGTGLYLRALTEGVIEIEQDDMPVREQLEKDLARVGAEKMHARLRQIDPLEAALVHANNTVRVLRALEIFELTGLTKSQLRTSSNHRHPKYTYEYFCLLPPRQHLYDIIDRRVDQMMASGLLNELERLVLQGMKDAIRRSNIIGYDELLDFLDGRLTIDEAVSLMKQYTRRYAKRQMTWFRKQTGCLYFGEPGLLMDAVAGRLTTLWSEREKT